MSRRDPKSRTGEVRVLVISVGVALACLLSGVAAAQPKGGRIAPNQVFGGLVDGNQPVATLAMACFGPVRPGETGHPMGGQTLSVFVPEAIRGKFGNTGSAGTTIVARFHDDQAIAVTFQNYGVAQPIPTKLKLPCSGTGKVAFTPRPWSKTARRAIVTVNYEGQP